MSNSVKRHSTPLDGAVLNELTKSLNGVTDTPNFNIRRLLDASEYQMDAEIRMDALGDDDWQDVKIDRDNKAVPSDRVVRLYDETEHKMYYVWKSGIEKLHFEPEIDSNEVPTGVNVSSTEGNPEGFDRQEVDKILDRLRLEDGQILPSGYQDWIAKKLQSRFLVENNIPGYANLCELCHRVLTHSWAIYESIVKYVSNRNLKRDPSMIFEVFHHYETIEALHASASIGCHLCSLLTFSQHSDTGTCDEGCNQSYHLEAWHRSSEHFTIKLKANEEFQTWLRCAWTETPLERTTTLKHAETDVLEVANLAKTWLARCLSEDRETCMMSTKFLPSRLVKITAKHDAIYSACVVLQNELPTDVQYLTLSHCWGTTKMVKLEEGTYKDYRVQIPFSSLSKTFREALKVTAWLGYQYIWIDSLCVLQDSEQDWENEAAIMGAIYRNSTCTIAATGAKDGDGGLFFRRSALNFESCPLSVGTEKCFSVSNMSLWPSPLSSRAWAVQERYLSPRVLSFGSDKISWSCGRTEACEGSNAHCVQLNEHAFPRLFDPQANERRTFLAWGSIVRQYSSCNLTYWKDRWPAFQGLASEIAKARSWKIVHGLRSHQLTTDLLWYTRRPETEVIDLGEPSWSWLNVKSRVLLHDLTRNESSDAEVALQESSAGEGSEDGVVNGVIQIKGCMTEFISEPQNGVWEDRACILNVSNPQFEPQDRDRSLVGLWYPDTFPLCNGQLWALQILTTYKNHHGGYVMKRYEGLVVVAVKGRPGFWRRVGMYWASSHRTKDSEYVHPWAHEKTTVYLI